jgi:hypothetical protein
MNFAIEMASGGMMKIGSAIQVILRVLTSTI